MVLSAQIIFDDCQVKVDALRAPKGRRLRIEFPTLRFSTHHSGPRWFKSAIAAMNRPPNVQQERCIARNTTAQSSSRLSLHHRLDVLVAIKGGHDSATSGLYFHIPPSCP